MDPKICQIMTYTDGDPWIRLGLMEHPRTSRLILICSSGKKGKPRDSNAVPNSKLGTDIDYFQQAKDLLEEFRKQEKDLPEKRKRKYHILNPPETNDPYGLIRFFRELFLLLIKNGEGIMINTTSGQQIWKLALYQIALEFRENIEDFYMIQKSTGEIKRIRLFRHLNDNEKNIIQIISEKPGLSIGELQKIFKMKYGKGNLTFIWRTVMKLIQEKLVKDEKKGREVKIALTDEGSSFVYTREYDKILLPLFRE